MDEDEINLNRYKIIRDYITHEDSLINNRLSWLLLSQGLIFGAFSGLFTPIANLTNELADLCVKCKSIVDVNNEILNLENLQVLLSLLGFFISFISFFGIETAVQAISRINKDYSSISQKVQLPSLTGGGNDCPKSLGIAPRGIPIALSCAWLYVIFKLHLPFPYYQYLVLAIIFFILGVTVKVNFVKYTGKNNNNV